MVKTLPTGTALVKTTWFTDAVTTILLQCLRAAILEALSIRANNSPPKRLSSGLVSPGRTRSVRMVNDSFDVFDAILILFKKN
jgi:hypothetical protein